MNNPETETKNPEASCAPPSGSEFVFIDAANKPFLVKNGWLWRWHEGSKNFVSLRKMVPGEEADYRRLRIPDDQAALYIPNTKLSHGQNKP